jgi:PAS domain S-box-containing protein
MPMADPQTRSAPTLTDILFERSGDGLCLVAPDGTVLRANAQWLRSTGFSEGQVVGEDIIDLFPETHDMMLAIHARARAGHRVDVPRHAQVVNGLETWWEETIEPVPMDGGTWLLITTREVPRDLAQQPEAQQALRASEARFRTMADNSPVILWVSDAHGDNAFVNRTYRDFFGVTFDEVEGRKWRPLVHPEDAPEYVESYLRAIREQAPFSGEARVRRNDGEWRWIASRGEPRYATTGEFLGHVGVSVDITDRKLAEQRLRESEERFRALVMATSDVIYRMSPDWSVMHTCTSGKFLADTDEPITTWLQKYIPPDSQPRVKAAIEEAIRTKSVFQLEHGVHRADGSVGWTLSRAVPMLDARGGIAEWFGAARDITIRKNAQLALEKANTQLREADRRKDEFLGMLSHELRNPLAPIWSSTYILRHAVPGSDQARRAQGVIERQTQHLTRLVDDLLDVTRISRGKIELRRTRVDLREVALRAADDFRVMMDERGLAFRLAVPATRMWADVDATRVTQVLGNLLHNAAKFSSRGDEVELSLRAVDEDAEISVRDTGAGIDPALLPEVFDPFVQGRHTLARTEGGLGLGLALVKGIAELHGGTVSAASAGIGKGAEFVVRLPLAPAVNVKDERREDLPRGEGGRRVLIVDDNRDAAESLAEIVKMFGHTPDVAFDGPSAIERALASPPDLVLCDIGLPGMSGYEVAMALSAQRANGTRLISVSGYAQPEDVQRAIEAGFDGHVAKPWDPEQIERLLS